MCYVGVDFLYIFGQGVGKANIVPSHWTGVESDGI